MYLQKNVTQFDCVRHKSMPTDRVTNLSFRGKMTHTVESSRHENSMICFRRSVVTRTAANERQYQYAKYT